MIRIKRYGINVSPCGRFCARGSDPCVHARAHYTTLQPYCKIDDEDLKEDKNNNLLRTAVCKAEGAE